MYACSKNLQPLRLYLVTSETTYTTSEKVTNAWKFPGGRDYIVTTAMVDYCQSAGNISLPQQYNYVLQTLLRGAAEVDESDLSVPINNLKVCPSLMCLAIVKLTKQV